MIDLLQDLRFGVRMLLRHKTVTLICLLTLGLGIGSSTAVFTLVDSALLSPPPLEQPDRLAMLFTTKPASGWTGMTISVPDFQDWSEQSSSFESTGIFGYLAVNVMGAEHPDRLLAIRASHQVLGVLRIQPSIGRSYDAADDDPGASPLVLLSDTVWRQRFAADPDVVGTTLRIDDVGHQIIGVLPPETEEAMGRFDVWTPFTYGPETQSRSFRHYSGIARLKNGVTAAEANRDLKIIGERIAEAFPDSNRGYSVNAVPLIEVLLGAATRPVLYVLCTAVGFVLLIACVNVANLLIATAGSREREFAIRAALGARPRRLLRQLLTESVLLAIGGGTLGVAFAYWIVNLFTARAQMTFGPFANTSVDSRALVFTILALGITSVGFGLPVALRASRSRFADVIRTNSRAVLGTPREKIRRNLLVIGQVALALSLMICAGLMIRSLLVLKAVDPGFDTQNLLTMRVSLPDKKYADEADLRSFFEGAVHQIGSLPGVRSVSASSMIPLMGSNSNSSMSIEEHPVSDPADKILVGNEAVMPGYLGTMGIPLLEGREFTTFDNADEPGVIIINRFMAQHFWPNESAIGKRVKFGPLHSNSPWREVIGVMADYRQMSLNRGIRFETLYPQAQIPSSEMTFVVRTASDPALMAAPVQQAIWKVGPDLAVYEIATMGEILVRNTRAYDDLTRILLGFGVMALVLALGGLYGVVSFSVGRRTQEIGLRMALGAEARTILHGILRGSALLVLFGVLAGGLIAWLLSRLLQGVLFGVSAMDPTAYVVVATGMLIVGLLATLIPALRATRIDPVIALRNE